MVSLVIKFADLAKDPIGSGRDVSAEVLVSYTREVPLTDGTVLQAVPTRKILGAGGTAIFEVTPSDDPTVQEAHKHFGLRVEWLLTHRAGRGRQTETRGSRVVQVNTSDGATVQFGRLVPAEPLPAKYASITEVVGDFDARLDSLEDHPAEHDHVMDDVTGLVDQLSGEVPFGGNTIPFGPGTAATAAAVIETAMSLISGTDYHLSQKADLKTTPGFVKVATGNESRPNHPVVFWVGGSTEPTNMTTGDVWLEP